MSVEPIKQVANTAPSKGARSEVRFPAYSLKDCVAVPEAIHNKGGGSATPDHLIAFLGYKSASNGAYLARIGAAKTYGLISKTGNAFVPTSLAHRIISPIYPDDAKRALLDAFFNVALFKQIYEDFKGKELPPEIGMKNALRNTYGVLSTRVDLAYRIFIESADQAGFFSTRGARTHLVIPSIASQPASNPNRKVEDETGGDESDLGGGGGGGGDSGDGGGDDRNGRQNPERPSILLQDVKAKYLNSLIAVFEKKTANGEIDEKLMERIERLLGGN